MSRTIWKYSLSLEKMSGELIVPKKTIFLTCQMQLGVPTIWASVDTESPKEQRYLYAIVGTGWPCPDPKDGSYLATVQNGNLVWHVFLKNAGLVLQSEEK